MATPVVTQKTAPLSGEAMNIARARPAEDGQGRFLKRMRRELERLMGPEHAAWAEALACCGGPGSLAGVETRDEAGQMVVRVETPGHPAENLEVLANDHYLTIRSLPPKAGGEAAPTSQPRAVHAVIPLPEGADRDKVEANYANGLLVVRVPKNPHGKTRTIPLQKS